ncbi:ABC transporter permease [Viridibacterium curvum]|uniref:ABC transporter permease n=1 Tax=Viridibacterium curvum TaxID=1101404 RepID=A0ABP9QWM6_9RHOO
MHASIERLLVPIGAVVIALMVFAVFVSMAGYPPLEVFQLIYKGGFGSGFSWNNTLQRAAPLILTGLAVALPARAGLVIIGGEGALVLGGLAAAIFGNYVLQTPTLLSQILMLLAGAMVGAGWIALCGWMRHARGINETISSLLMAYIGIALLNHFVEGPLKDPASLNKPSTMPIPTASMLGLTPGFDVHIGLLIGVVVAVVAWLVLRFTTLGFALKVVGGNPRAAQLAGLRVGVWLIAACAAGGACAGLAGAIEVAAVHGSANASLISGYGYAGILIAFMARQNPLAVVPVAMLIGGIGAAGGMLQRRLDMPDATVMVLQGMAFIAILASETLMGSPWRKIAARLWGIEIPPEKGKS